MFKNLIFFDNNKDRVREAKRLEKYGIRVIDSDVRDLFNDYNIGAIVSPANSFGYMNGGIDEVYMELFQNIQTMVQNTITSVGLKTTDNREYLPIGSSITVPTKNKKCPFLIVSPTMFFPGNILGTNNVFISFISILHIVKQNKDTIIACPNLGTGVGQIPINLSIDQIESAINNYDSFIDNAFYKNLIKYRDNNNLILNKIPCEQPNIYANKYIPQ
jgi:O-acetyl-ADP-ribose deacetylase (regulator of RNase III)